MPCAELESFVGYLRGEFSGWRDNECADVGVGELTKVETLEGSGRGVAIGVGLTGQLGQGVQTGVNGGNEEGLDTLARASLRLER